MPTPPGCLVIRQSDPDPLRRWRLLLQQPGIRRADLVEHIDLDERVPGGAGKQRTKVVRIDHCQDCPRNSIARVMRFSLPSRMREMLER